jgi:GNAT superfamily N-acetyltransferase
MLADHPQRIIRAFNPAEAAEVTQIWHRSGRARFTYLPTWQTFTLEEARRVFDTVIQPRCVIWVAADSERIVAFLAMKDRYIDRLCVDPPEWRKGWGTELIKFAKQLCPSGLELHTHQANVGARALYERHGFHAVKFGLSPGPESAPDVEYHWRPA